MATASLPDSCTGGLGRYIHVRNKRRSRDSGFGIAPSEVAHVLVSHLRADHVAAFLTSRLRDLVFSRGLGDRTGGLRGCPRSRQF